MKKIRLYAYFNSNLGDDLMVDILLKKFSDHQFFTHEYISLDAGLSDNKNFIHRELLFQRYGRLNHLLNILTFNKLGTSFLDKLLKKHHYSCDCAVYIGGSIFIQEPEEDV